MKLYSQYMAATATCQFTCNCRNLIVWTIDIFSGRADVKIDNIQARSHLWLGKGDAHRSKIAAAPFSITSATRHVRMRHFTESATPEIPPLPREEHHISIEEPESWGEWEEWAEWGGEFGKNSCGNSSGTGWSNRGITSRWAKAT